MEVNVRTASSLSVNVLLRCSCVAYYTSFKPHLFVELWLDVIDMLGTAELCALATSCRPLYFLIHCKAPFRVITLFNDNLERTKILSRCPTLLLSARTIRWEASALMYAPRSTTYSAKLFNKASITLRTLLQTLSASTSLVHLTLHHVEVAPAQQKIILALKNLRSLTLICTNFLESDQIFPISRIRSLRIQGGVRVGPTVHILSCMASYLDDLDLYFFNGLADELDEPLSSIGFPIVRRVSFRDVPPLASMRALSSAHVVSYGSNFGIERFKSSQAFPALSKLSAPPSAAAIALIVQVRPVRIYHQHKESGVVYPEHVLGVLQSLKLSRRPLTELRIFIRWNVRGFLQMLASELPALTRLELYIGKHQYNQHTFRNGKIDWAFLTECWPEPQATMGDTNLYHLQVIRVCFAAPRSGDPPTPFPVSPCSTLFGSFINPVCPDLRRAEFIALKDETEMDNIDTQAFEPNECFILGRAALHMEWEERVFGTFDEFNTEPRMRHAQRRGPMAHETHGEWGERIFG